MSKVAQIRYTSDMTITDKIYDAVDGFRFITSIEAMKGHSEDEETATTKTAELEAVASKVE